MQGQEIILNVCSSREWTSEDGITNEQYGERYIIKVSKSDIQKLDKRQNFGPYKGNNVSFFVKSEVGRPDLGEGRFVLDFEDKDFPNYRMCFTIIYNTNNQITLDQQKLKIMML